MTASTEGRQSATEATDGAAPASGGAAPGPPAGSRRRAPDFFIVGNPKSGTTALYEMFKAHPQIYMPDLKEPWFFATDLRARFQPRRSGALPHTLEDYLALFEAAMPGQRLGEATSSYLFSRTAANGIGQLRPDARIIAILREPAGFLHSLHTQLLKDHIETQKSLGRALALEPARRRGAKTPRRSHVPQLLLYSDHVRYVENLARYHAVFPAEQVRVLIYDDFRADNAATVRGVWRFLGVDEHAPLAPVEANKTDTRIRSQQLDDLVTDVAVGRGPVSRAVKTGAKALVPRAVRRGALRATHQRVVYRKADPPDERLMLELRRRFKGEVVALSEYLDRDLVTFWGYDRV